ncbi:putative leader peptide [Rhodococcus sp. 3Y1]
MKAVEGGFDTAWSRRHVDLCRTADLSVPTDLSVSHSHSGESSTSLFSLLSQVIRARSPFSSQATGALFGMPL